MEALHDLVGHLLWQEVVTRTLLNVSTTDSVLYMYIFITYGKATIFYAQVYISAYYRYASQAPVAKICQLNYQAISYDA